MSATEELIAEKMFSTQAAAKYLGVHKNTVLRWIDEKRLRAEKLGSPALKRKAAAYAIPQSALDELMQPRVE